MKSWDPTLYLKFDSERTRPALDLVSRIDVEQPARIIDLGCGPGNSTAVLRQRWPDADIIGLDNSLEMIEAATHAYPMSRWLQADIASWKTEMHYDVVFSNAALQWLPNHAQLFPQLMGRVASAGALAVQMPSHYESPLHQVVLNVANAAPWRDRMDTARNVLTKESANTYYDILQPLSSRLDIWETEYFHIQDSHQSIIGWFRATGLRPFLNALDTEDERQTFEKMVLDGYMQAYPAQKDSRIPLPFRRIFIIAYR